MQGQDALQDGILPGLPALLLRHPVCDPQDASRPLQKREACFMNTETVQCSLCGKTVPESEVCGTLACRACHVSVTFEDCVNRTTPEELAWEARKRAALDSQEGKRIS